MTLPLIICLKSVYNDKYLRYCNDDATTNGLVQFSGETVVDPLAQFQVVTAESGHGLVHLKSCYSRKYLVRWSPNHYWIAASAETPNEVQTDWSCTLFKPYCYKDGFTDKARLRHVQLGHYVGLREERAPYDSCLHASSKSRDQNSCDVFTIIDWLSINKLPKNVAFKGDEDKYLGAFLNDGIPYLKFAYDDVDDPKVAQELCISNDGIIRIKSKYFGKYWRLGAEKWIVADVVEPGTTDTGAMFRAHLLDHNVVALLNMSNACYCKRYTDYGKENMLNAIMWTTTDICAKLQVTNLDDEIV
ncbi:uncharacterized protein LOC141594203 [Silene latifolia]|uniref:uncharacterized protein LOC141594203 n=1 Tax=Silene latifolia TaxID=37657 RepID=UPI003D7873A3